MADGADDAHLVAAARDGDDQAFGELFDRWSDRCFDVARRILHDDGRAADVAQDTFVVAWRQLDTLRDPSAFGGWVLRTARNKALNRLEHERRATPTDAVAPVFADLDGDVDVEAEVTAADHRAMVWAAAAALGERDASVLDLHLRHGLGAAEIAEELGVTTNNAHQLLFRMKQRLASGIRAWIVFRGGDPACPALRAALTTAEVDRFGPTAVKVVGRHLDDCEDCTRRQAAVLAPEALFASAPILALAPDLRRQVLEGLRAQGVPVDPAATPTTATPPHPVAGEGGDGPPDDGDAAPEEASGGRRRRAVALLAAAAVLVGVGLALLLLPGDDDPDEVAAVATEAPTSAPATDGAPSSTTTTEAEPPPTMVVIPRDGDPPATEAAPTTATTAPADAPPAPPPSTFTPGASTTAPPAAPVPPAAPSVDAFTATPAANPGAGGCGPNEWATTFAWSTTDATSAAITGSGEPAISGLAADGSHVACRFTPSPPPGGWTLTATGPGGTDQATAP
ncbi:MAG: sigma-70 family RNA polymerase sigma factor [Acidimicrobiales bacterium]|nr:sigma-70 family RNA polymerase sigma factor [Acidimicrobiales bacterium]